MCNQPGTKLERGEIVNVKNTPDHPLCNFQEMLNQATGQYLSKASVTHRIRSTLEELLWIFGSLFKCKCVLEETSAERVQSGGAVKLWWRLKCVGSCFPHFFFTVEFPLPAMWEMRDGVLEETQSEQTERFQVTELLLSPLQPHTSKAEGWEARCYTAKRPVHYSLALGLSPVLQTGLALGWCWKGFRWHKLSQVEEKWCLKMRYERILASKSLLAARCLYMKAAASEKPNQPEG